MQRDTMICEERHQYKANYSIREIVSCNVEKYYRVMGSLYLIGKKNSLVNSEIQTNHDSNDARQGGAARSEENCTQHTQDEECGFLGKYGSCQ